MIVSATISDAITLTEIALKSKAFWGYTDQQIKSWIADLTVSEKIIQELIVYKYIFEKKIVGFYVLNQTIEKNIELEFLFVLPPFIGKGIGNQLIKHAFEKSVSLKCKQITVLADPNAASFYESKGFETIDQKESSIAGRFLPVMRKILI